MNNLMRLCTLTILFICSLSHGQNNNGIRAVSAKETPSIESVRELLKLTSQEEIKTFIGLRTKSIDKIIEENIDSRLGNDQQNLAAEKLNREYREQAKILLEEESKWENYESEIIKIYQSELTKDEINKMIPFFKTQLGQTILGKLPLINQKVVAQIYKTKFSQPSKFEKLTTKYKASFKEIMPLFIRPDSSPLAKSFPQNSINVRPQLIQTLKKTTAELSFGSSTCPAPTYPNASLRNEEQGSITADVNLNADGIITNATIAKSSNFINLDNALLEHLLSGVCRGTPATINGVATSGLAKIIFIWKL